MTDDQHRRGFGVSLRQRFERNISGRWIDIHETRYVAALQHRPRDDIADVRRYQDALSLDAAGSQRRPNCRARPAGQPGVLATGQVAQNLRR